jgi:glycosyltransferase involved in cell wall biosynthesis
MTGISIAMATYNGAAFLQHQLDSLANQTMLPDELVVTDDNSTDDTLAMISDFAARAPFPVRFIKNASRLGYRANFMKAARLCKSELIAFCDQDDEWLRHKLERCHSTFKTQEVLLVFHNATVVNEDLRPIGTLKSMAPPRKFNPPHSMGWRSAYGFALVFRSSLLNLGNWWPQSANYLDSAIRESHDDWFFFLASSLGTVTYIEEPLVLYRQHTDNALGWPKPSETLVDRIAAIDVDGLERRSVCAGKRALILEMIARQPVPFAQPHAQLSAAGYRKIERFYRMRSEAHSSGSLSLFARRIVAVLLAGGYRSPARWGLGRNELIKDLARRFAPLGRQ